MTIERYYDKKENDRVLKEIEAYDNRINSVIKDILDEKKPSLWQKIKSLFWKEKEILLTDEEIRRDYKRVFIERQINPYKDLGYLWTEEKSKKP